MPTDHDPFAPHYAVGQFAAPEGAFPTDRLARAGLAEDHVERLREWFDGAEKETRDTWLSGVASAPDQAIAARYAAPEGLDLSELKKDQLEDVLRAREQPVTGNKADLIARVTDTTPSEPAGDAETPAEGGEPQEAVSEPQIETQAPDEPVTSSSLTEAPLPSAPAPDPSAGQPQEPSHEPPVAAPQGQPGEPQQPTSPAEHARRSTRRSGGTGQGAP